jgi:hypothetical protein
MELYHKESEQYNCTMIGREIIDTREEIEEEIEDESGYAIVYYPCKAIHDTGYYLQLDNKEILQSNEFIPLPVLYPEDLTHVYVFGDNEEWEQYPKPPDNIINLAKTNISTPIVYST